MINSSKKMLFFRTAFSLPIVYYGISIPTVCIGWLHGYAAYFNYIILVLALISVPAVLINYKNFYLFSMLGLFIAMLFNIYGMVLLFYPQYSGWDGWNSSGTWVKVYFDSSADFSVWTLSLFMAIFILFAVKKFFEIDYEKMKKEAFKDKKIDKGDNQVFLNQAMCVIASLRFNVKYLAKLEHRLTIAAISILLIVIVPMKSAGSSMVAFGNNFFIALFFFASSYFFLWFSYWVALTSFGQYRLINKIEKDLGVKLKPAMRPRQVSMIVKKPTKKTRKRWPF